jgi:hypothetical protein
MAHIHKPTMSTEVCGQPMNCERVEWADASHDPPRWKIVEEPRNKAYAVFILVPQSYHTIGDWFATETFEEAVRIAMRETK